MYVIYEVLEDKLMHREECVPVIPQSLVYTSVQKLMTENTQICFPCTD